MNPDDFSLDSVGEWFVVSGRAYLMTDNISQRPIFQTVVYGSFQSYEQANDLFQTLKNVIEQVRAEAAHTAEIRRTAN